MINNFQERENPDQTIIHLFEEQIKKTPEAIALTFQGTKMTYRELDEKTNRLARYLRAKGISSESLVAVLTKRSPNFIIGILGVLKAGGAYVPIDIEYPEERIRFIFEDTKISYVLTELELTNNIPIEQQRIICLDREQDAISSMDSDPLSILPLPQHLAYIIYTSGSTGQPKGVMIEHRSVVNHQNAVSEIFDLTPHDRVLQFASVSFDASVEEIFPTLLSGATLVLETKDELLSNFVDVIEREKITVLNLPTAFWHVWVYEMSVSTQSPPASVRLVIIGGEKASEERVKRWEKINSSITLINTYGPTETTVTATTYTKGTSSGEQEKDSKLPIGKPIHNTKAYILDAQLKPVPTGVIGELYIGGEGVARGYLNREDLTRESFLDDPFQKRGRMYRTGDMARFLADGNIEYIGRIDDQVKVRGFRIELGEVESVLKQHPDVKDAVLLAKKDLSQSHYLNAYIVLKNKHTVAEELKKYLKTKLPSYMVPSTFVFIPELPLTPSGKVDRKQLIGMDTEKKGRTGEDHAPRNEIERAIIEIWEEVLQKKNISIHDHFLDLGGHSLLVIQVISRIRDRFDIDLPIRTLIELPTVALLAEQVQKTARKNPQTKIAVYPINDDDSDIPLSCPQEGVWFTHHLDPDNLAYHFQARIAFSGNLNIPALEKALNLIIQRHEIFRTTFHEKNGKPYQKVHQSMSYNLKVIDLSTLSNREQASEIDRYVKNEISRSFDISKLPLVRWSLLKLSNDQHVLLHVEHHLLHDGWSFHQFLRELYTSYQALHNGNQPTLPHLPLQFADYTRWQQRWINSDQAKKQLDYWQRKIGDRPPVLELPSDFARQKQQSFRGSQIRMELPLNLCKSLRKLSTELKTTLFMTTLAVFKTLMYRYTGKEDILIGSAFANRSLRESENLIGMLVNVVPLRTDLSGEISFKELLNRVSDVVMEAYDYQQYPLNKLVESLRVQRDLSFNPLFQVAFSFHDSPLPELDMPELSADVWTGLHNGSAKFDLNIVVTPRYEGKRKEAEWGITVDWEYNSDLYNRSTIERMVGHYQYLLEQIVKDPDQKISKLDILTRKEQQQVVVDWNQTKTDYPHHLTLVDLFEAQVEQTPEKTAVFVEEKGITYQELNRKANQLAHLLRRKGVHRESLVGISVKRSLDMVTGILAILKAGGGYVPIDFSLPSKRVEYIMEDSGISLWLLHNHMEIPHSYSGETLYFEQLDLTSEAVFNPKKVGQVNDLAYVIYTSGSTGKPKGVAIEHRSVVNYLYWFKKALMKGEPLNMPVITSLSFDATVTAVFAPLVSGSAVVLYEEEHAEELMLKAVEDSRVGILKTTPSHLKMIQHNPIKISSKKRIILGGEELEVSFARKILNQFDHKVELYNAYGPTEATVICTAYPFDPNQHTGRSVPIGRSGDNQQLYILDKEMKPVPVGVPGELYIGGKGVARGYLNRPELTRKRFVPNPFDEGEKLYKTGDLARWLSNGTIEYIGRIDQQVKIRGYRIELEEVKIALETYPGVKDAVVFVKNSDNGSSLVAAIVPSDSDVIEKELKRHLSSLLPAYMIPSRVIKLPSLPINASGKLDLRALNELTITNVNHESLSEKPRDDIESRLVAIFAEVLDLDQVGIGENFFELGGHSLAAVQVLYRLKNEWGIQLPIRVLFESPTVSELGEKIRKYKGEEFIKSKTIHPVQLPDGYYPLSYTQERMWFLSELHLESSLYNISTILELQGKLNLSAMKRSLETIVKRHESLRTRFTNKDGVPKQFVLPLENLDCGYNDLSSLENDREAIALEHCKRELKVPFDLRKELPIRFEIIKLNETRHWLLIVVHHIVFDGWSMDIFLQEFSTLYRAYTKNVIPELEDSPIQYKDYAYWQRQTWDQSALLSQLNYWKEKLSNFPQGSVLTLDFERPSVPSFNGSEVSVWYPPELVESLKKLSVQEGTSLYMTFLSLFKALLYIHSGQEDLVVGTPLTNRNQSEVEHVIGCFVNTTVLRTEVTDNPTYRKFLQQIRENTLEALRNQDLPFDMLVRELFPERNLNQSPLFQVMFAYESDSHGKLKLPEIEADFVDLDREKSKFDLTMYVTEIKNDIKVSFEYSTDVFKHETIQELLQDLVSITEQVLENPDLRLSELLLNDLSKLSASELDRLF